MTEPCWSTRLRMWNKDTKQTVILTFIVITIAFLLAAQKRGKLPASINKQRDGMDGRKKNEEMEECGPINLRL